MVSHSLDWSYFCLEGLPEIRARKYRSPRKFDLVRSMTTEPGKPQEQFRCVTKLGQPGTHPTRSPKLRHAVLLGSCDGQGAAIRWDVFVGCACRSPVRVWGRPFGITVFVIPDQKEKIGRQEQPQVIQGVSPGSFLSSRSQVWSPRWALHPQLQGISGNLMFSTAERSLRRFKVPGTCCKHLCAAGAHRPRYPARSLNL